MAEFSILPTKCHCSRPIVLMIFLEVISSAALSASTSSYLDLERCIEDVPHDATHAELNRCIDISRNSNENRESQIPVRIDSFTPELQERVVSPSSNIRGHVFVCECNKRRSMFATASALLFTADGFATYHKITIDPQLIGNTDVVESIALTMSSVFLVMGGKLFIAEEGDRSILNFTQASMNNTETITPDKILGVSGPAICYNGNQMTKQNLKVYAWGRSSVYKFSHDQSRFDILSWLELDGMTHSDFSIVKVQIAANPIYLAVTSFFDDTLTFQHCVTTRLYHGCETVMSRINATDSQVLASARFLFLVWDERNLTMVANSDSFISHTLNDMVDCVHFSYGKSSWLVKTVDDNLYYGTIHSIQPKILNISLPVNSSIIFIDNGRIGVISYSDDETLGINVYEIESLLAPIHNPPQFHPQVLHSNVVLIGNALDTVKLQLAAVRAVDDSFIIVAYERFGRLPIVSHQAHEMTTYQTSSNLVLRERKLTVTLSWNCREIKEICPRGFGLIELAFVPDDNHLATALGHAHSNLYVISATCPTGLHLRLDMGSSSEQGDCSWSGNPCVFKIRKQEQLFLKFQLWQDQRFLNDMSTDVLLTELQNIAGFNYHDYNLLKKACYQCSRFHPRSSPSQLLLQTTRSACPCKVDGTNDNGWIGNLSFINVGQHSILKFSAKALSSSFCDLSTEFNIELISDADLTYHYLEYVSMLVSVAVVGSALFLSYFNYFTKTKDKEGFLDTTR